MGKNRAGAFLKPGFFFFNAKKFFHKLLSTEKNIHHLKVRKNLFAPENGPTTDPQKIMVCHLFMAVVLTEQVQQ